MNGQFINVRTDMSDRKRPLKDSEGEHKKAFPAMMPCVDYATRAECIDILRQTRCFLPVPSV